MASLNGLNPAMDGTRFIVAIETRWDVDLAGPGTETFWDVDLAGPGTRTIWDLLPDTLKLDGLAMVLPSRWLASTTPGRWLGKVLRT